MSYLIEDIEDESLVAEMNVIDALMASYVKEATMLEYTTKEVVEDCFYQEGEKWDKFKQDANASVFGNKGEKLLKRIIMFIPRLIAAIIKKFRNHKNKTSPKLTEKSVENTESSEVEERIKEYLQDFDNYIARHPDLDEDHIQAIKEIIRFTTRYHDGVITADDDYFEKLAYFCDKTRQLVEELDKVIDLNPFENDNLKAYQSLNDRVTAIIPCKRTIPNDFSYFPIKLRECSDRDNHHHPANLPIEINDLLKRLNEMVAQLNQYVNNRTEASDQSKSVVLNILLNISYMISDINQVEQAHLEIDKLFDEYVKWAENGEDSGI